MKMFTFGYLISPEFRTAKTTFIISIEKVQYYNLTDVPDGRKSGIPLRLRFSNNSANWDKILSQLTISIQLTDVPFDRIFLEKRQLSDTDLSQLTDVPYDRN